MNETFSNHTSQLIITDNGIVYRNDTLRQNIYYPYGSITEFKVGLTGLSLKGGAYTSPYIPTGDQKKRLKALAPIVLNLNAKAPKCAPRVAIIDKAPEKPLEKNVQSILNFFAPYKPNEEHVYLEGIGAMLSAMDWNEKLLHGCRGSVLYINKIRVDLPFNNDLGDSVVSPIILITDKCVYYAGFDGDCYGNHLKTGSFELQHVHDIALVAKTFTTPAFVQFMVHTNDYKITTLENAEEIKQKLEAGVKAAFLKSADAARVYGVATVQTGIRSNAATQTQPTSQPASAVAEIKQYKELLDSGIITQEEFEAKKKQLLGL